MAKLSKIFQFYCDKLYRKYHNRRGIWRGRQILRNILSFKLPQAQHKESIFEEEWDNLIILDACRYDVYQEIKADVDSRTSLGSKTSEFVKKTFSEGELSNIVYITGNPHFNRETFLELTGREVEETFHDVFHTYQTDWDNEENTVLPEKIVRDMETARKLFPDKKIIGHFMQPHYPFIGSNLTKEGIRPDLDSEKEGFNIWERAEMGDYDSEELREAYKNNLEIALDEVENLVEKLKGKTIITSDHGNLIGEEGIYGHPQLYSNPESLYKVPWDVYE